MANEDFDLSATLTIIINGARNHGDRFVELLVQQLTDDQIVEIVKGKTYNIRYNSVDDKQAREFLARLNPEDLLVCPYTEAYKHVIDASENGFDSAHIIYCLQAIANMNDKDKYKVDKTIRDKVASIIQDFAENQI